jgi:hypothetical protein
MEIDTVEQTIEKLMTTINKLSLCAQTAIDHIDSDTKSKERMKLRDQLHDILKHHYAQY